MAGPPPSSASAPNRTGTDSAPSRPDSSTIPFGDAEALEWAITPNTVAFLVEPIQGEGGIIVPPHGYLKKVREIYDRNNVLLILDEIQTGLGRTGKLFAEEHEGIKSDLTLVGKVLSGGVYPVSAVLSNKEALAVFEPGDHGSTFGSNPLRVRRGTRSIGSYRRLKSR